MYGTNRKLTAIQCRVCKKFVALRVDDGDFARWQYGGVLIQDCMPYLCAADRELLLSATCGACWALLCPADPMAYS